ncbi:hypothetical protein CQW23_12888 [Capsicum baccatum]|uniref:Uncharacterized protein n=1 Tax=Capsicum baccatum TaxID=33114 RepID=A0A2G2WU23_CAPBA|nr:hypothetical protein CQW23_12888 [Capsicum baccatum]
MPVNAKSSNRRPAGRPSNAHSAPRYSGRPRKTSTALRGGVNLAYKRPRQKKAKEAGFGVLFGPSVSVVEMSGNTDRVLHSPTLISLVPTNIDLGFKPNGLMWSCSNSKTATTTE